MCPIEMELNGTADRHSQTWDQDKNNNNNLENILGWFLVIHAVTSVVYLARQIVTKVMTWLTLTHKIVNKVIYCWSDQK